MIATAHIFHGCKGCTTPDPDESPEQKPELDAEAKQLQLEQFKAEARKAIAEANVGASKARLYEPKSEPVKGETTVGEKSGSLLNVVALRALEHLATDIHNDVLAKIGSEGSVLIVESRSLAVTDAPYVEIATRFAWFAERFATVHEELQQPVTDGAGAAQPAVAFLAPAAALQVGTAALSMVGLAADLVGMFKTNYSLQSRDVSVDYTALASLVARNLADSSVTVVVDGFYTLEQSTTLKTLNELLQQRSVVEELALQREAVELAAPTNEIEALTTRIAAASSQHDKAREAGETEKADRAVALMAELKTELAQKENTAYRLRQAQVAMAKTLVATFDQYVAAISTVPEAQTYPPLIASALRDVLHEGIQIDDVRVPINYVLYLTVSSSGGDISTQSGLFTRNEHVGLVGAVQATYILIDRAGVVKTSRSRGAYSAAKFKIGDNKLEF